MKFSQFGSDNGKTVIYFHGAPGAPEECAIFDLYAKEQGLTFICFDRFSGDYSTAGEAYYQFFGTGNFKASRRERGRCYRFFNRCVYRATDLSLSG